VNPMVVSLAKNKGFPILVNLKILDVIYYMFDDC